MGWHDPGPIAPGATVTFTYTAEVQAGDGAGVGRHDHNTAKVGQVLRRPEDDLRHRWLLPRVRRARSDSGDT